MNWYQIFYWLTVANTVGWVFTVLAIIAGVYVIIATIAAAGAFTESGKSSWGYWEKQNKKLYIVVIVIFFFSLCLTVFIPSKKDFILIIAGGAVGEFVTNDSTAKKIPGDLTYLIHSYLKKEIDNIKDDVDPKIEIMFQTPKEAFLEKMKKASKDQLEEFISKGDSSIIINIK